MPISFTLGVTQMVMAVEMIAEADCGGSANRHRTGAQLQGWKSGNQQRWPDQFKPISRRFCSLLKDFHLDLCQSFSDLDNVRAVASLHSLSLIHI